MQNLKWKPWLDQEKHWRNKVCTKENTNDLASRESKKLVLKPLSKLSPEAVCRKEKYSYDYLPDPHAQFGQNLGKEIAEKVKGQRTLKMPCSNIKFIIIGTAVNIPIWTKNCVFNADCNAAFWIMLLSACKDASTPDNACRNKIISQFISPLFGIDISKKETQTICNPWWLWFQ